MFCCRKTITIATRFFFPQELQLIVSPLQTSGFYLHNIYIIHICIVYTQKLDVANSLLKCFSSIRESWNEKTVSQHRRPELKHLYR